MVIMQNGGARGTALPNGQKRASGGVFAQSMERREYEMITINSRRGHNSLDKFERGLNCMSKQSGTLINHQMKQLQLAQARRESKLHNTNQLKDKLKTKWPSLPAIKESGWCEDPYPVVFQSIQSIKLPDGGRMFPRQRRKSIEYEDFDQRLSIVTIGDISIYGDEPSETDTYKKTLTIETPPIETDLHKLSPPITSSTQSTPQVSPQVSPKSPRKVTPPSESTNEQITYTRRLVRPNTAQDKLNISRDFNKTEQDMIRSSPLSARKKKTLESTTLISNT